MSSYDSFCYFMIESENMFYYFFKSFYNYLILSSIGIINVFYYFRVFSISHATSLRNLLMSDSMVALYF